MAAEQLQGPVRGLEGQPEDDCNDGPPQPGAGVVGLFFEAGRFGSSEVGVVITQVGGITHIVMAWATCWGSAEFSKRTVAEPLARLTSHASTPGTD